MQNPTVKNDEEQSSLLKKHKARSPIVVVTKMHSVSSLSMSSTFIMRSATRNASSGIWWVLTNKLTFLNRLLKHCMHTLLLEGGFSKVLHPSWEVPVQGV
jgi:seryl-tRNA synthetase